MSGTTTNPANANNTNNAAEKLVIALKPTFEELKKFITLSNSDIIVAINTLEKRVDNIESTLADVTKTLADIKGKGSNRTTKSTAVPPPIDPNSTTGGSSASVVDVTAPPPAKFPSNKMYWFKAEYIKDPEFRARYTPAAVAEAMSKDQTIANKKDGATLGAQGQFCWNAIQKDFGDVTAKINTEYAVALAASQAGATKPLVLKQEVVESNTPPQ